MTVEERVQAFKAAMAEAGARYGVTMTARSVGEQLGPKVLVGTEIFYEVDPNWSEPDANPPSAPIPKTQARNGVHSPVSGS